MPSVKVEIPIFGRDHALRATTRGAHRLEINAPSSYALSGLTPSPLSFALVATTLASAAPRSLRHSTTHASPPPLRVMLRQRGPDGGEPTAKDLYANGADMTEMREALVAFLTADVAIPKGALGFVFAVLDVDGNVDVARCRSVIDAAMDAPCTMHRAIDSIFAAAFEAEGEAGIDRVLGDLVEAGFSAVLTSGRPGNAVDNVDILKVICAKAKGKIEVIIGGGVRVANAQQIIDAVGDMSDVWLHSSCLDANGKFVDEELAGLLALEY